MTIATAESIIEQKKDLQRKIAEMKPVKRTIIRIDPKMVIETTRPDGAKERWLNEYKKSDENRIIRGRQHK